MDSTKGVPSLWQRLTTSQQRYRNLQHMCPHVERLQVRRKQNPPGKRPWIQRSSDGALIWHAATQLTLKPGRQVFFTTQTSKLTDVKLRYAKRLPDPVMKLELIFFFLSTWLLICLTTHARRVHRRDLIVFPGGGAGADDRIRTPDPPWTASSGTHSNQRFLDQNSSVCASCCLKRQNNLIYVFICQRS